MNIDDLTLRQLKEIQALTVNKGTSQNTLGSLNKMIGEKVIIRTYSAGVWFGTLSEKAGNEVIIKNARRMWEWFAKESISLSSCANYGINQEKSKIVEAVNYVWLEAIEIIPCTERSINSIEGAENVTAK